MNTRRGAVLLSLTVLILITLVPLQAQANTVRLSTQRFEHGLMVWRADNATIYVLGDDGKAAAYGSPSYSNLPDNPIFGTPPTRLRPIFGFGKVWGNIQSVRDWIGWPTLAEIGFESTLIVQNNTVYITELDGTRLEIKGNTWKRLTATIPSPTSIACPNGFFWGAPLDDVCPAAPVTSQAAYQPYEHGAMIWLANQGDIWVFVEAPSGTQPRWYHFAQANYEGFADAPAQTPPANRVMPVNGFGRVWYNLKTDTGQNFSTALGWATAPETSYTATTQLFGRANHVHIYVSAPGGHVADAYSGLAGIFWSWIK
jgi:hypothetical protein